MDLQAAVEQHVTQAASYQASIGGSGAGIAGGVDMALDLSSRPSREAVAKRRRMWEPNN